MLLPAGMKSRLPLTSTILMELVELIGPAFWNQEPIAISSTNRNILRGSPPLHFRKELTLSLEQENLMNLFSIVL